MSRRAWLLAAAIALGAPRGARAHEVLHEVERNRAVAVRVFFADGEPVAYAQYEVYSPGEREIPHQKGRTDRNGWVAFVPVAPGPWRVKVVDATGHGLDATVDVAPGAPGAAPSAAAAMPRVAFVLRPLVGLAAIAAVFAVLLALQRRRAPR